MIGADICGFIYDTTEELCARWIEVGAFYPFSRNHNAINNKPQELYLWPTVAEASKKALSLRYQLLPYIYTLFSQATMQGLTVARALWMQFPADTQAVSVDRQFMLGSDVLVSPVLDQGSTSVSAYFPAGLWYPVAGKTVSSTPIDTTSGGRTIVLDTPLTYTNVHVRGGSVVPMQDAAMTTTVARSTPFTLLVSLCEHGKAQGSLYWDDGEQVQLDSYFMAHYFAQVDGSTGSIAASTVANTLANSPQALATASQLVVGTIKVQGPKVTCSAAAAAVTVNGSPFGGSTQCSAGVVTFSDANIKLTADFSLEWK